MMRPSAAATGGLFPLRRLLMRWLLFGFTALAFVLCFTRHGAGAWGFWLLVGLTGIVATTLAFAQARIAGNARSDNLSEYDLRRLREGRPPLDHGRSTSDR
jgi:hypothetical protein